MELLIITHILLIEDTVVEVTEYRYVEKVVLAKAA